MNKLFYLLTSCLFLSFGSAIAQAPSTFSYTGGMQTFTVPASYSHVIVEAEGGVAGDGYLSSSRGGYGGRVVCTLSVTPLQVLNVFVGGRGTNAPTTCCAGAPGGYNGGGFASTYYGGGGGGASDVRIGGTALANRVVVAGGGGGGSFDTWWWGGGGGMYPDASRGGDGGDTVGEHGYANYGYPSMGWGTWWGSSWVIWAGDGGHSTSGGSAGRWFELTLGTTAYVANPGVLGIGGNSLTGGWGGAGGGGYYGGGGGTYYSGGGGGSSYTDPTIGYGVTHMQGAHISGHGVVTITPFCGPGAITGTAVLCVGNTTVLSDTATSGTWTSANPGVATIGSTTGIVTGVAAGTAVISFQVPMACGMGLALRTVTVNPMPAPITGAPDVCVGSTITLSDNIPGGTWTSGSPAVATIGSTGDLLGVAPGTSVITFSAGTGAVCSVTKTITVNPLPTAIIVPGSGCAGYSITLSDASTGGRWTSSAPTVATIGSLTGIVTGGVTGTTVITYTLPTGCLTTTSLIINPVPAPVTGVNVVCVGAATNFTTVSTTGTWSSSAPSVATVGSLSGLIQGITAGTATISYVFPTGCFAIRSLTVNPNPVPISGPTSLCVSSTITMSDATPGGVWSSSGYGFLSINPSSGVITGLGAGVEPITYTLGTGCFITATITVNPLPAPITGITNLCLGSATTLTSSGTGSWTSSAPGTAPVGLTTGVVTGGGLGSAIITYSFTTGCLRTTTVNVYPNPAPISGVLAMCAGTGTILSDATSGGTWSSSAPGIASVGSATGVVTGASIGTAVISYTIFPTGCFTTTTVSVTPPPGPIIGSLFTCVGSSITFSDATFGGTWTSSAPGVATVGLTSGIVTGASAGVATISYSLGAGCTVTKSLTIYPPLAPIAGTLGVCIGGTTTLTNTTFGGTWSSGSPGVATIGSSTGIVTGITPGTTVITFTSGSCNTMSTVTVNPSPVAYTVTGGGGYCTGGTGATIGLSNSDVGVSYQPYIGTTPTGSPQVGTGSPLIFGPFTTVGTYTIRGTAAGCTSVMTGSVTISINPLPAPITGNTNVCVGSTTILSDASAPGTWASSNTNATIGTLTGVVTGITTGASVITFTANSTGCSRTTTVTINPLPSAISGPTGVCAGASIVLTNSGGGTWLSSAPAIATIGSATGIVNGLVIGSSVITYTLPTGCRTTTTINVTPAPTAIIGPANICAGSTVTLSDGITGGSWTSGTPAVATIGLLTGDVLALAPGTTLITYSLGTGCTITKSLTVTPGLPGITGSTSICVGATTTLSNATTGGTWSSSMPGVAPISSTGVVTGSTLGTTLIGYTLGGCTVNVTVTVNPTPGPITGLSSVCQGMTITLSDAIGGGTWTSSAPGVAAVGLTSGIVSGVTSGVANISYSLGGSCTVTKSITVNPITPIVGPVNVCVGLIVNLTDATAGGAWSSSVPTVASVTSSGAVTGLTTGTTVISYILPSGCYAASLITVNTVPVPITGPGNVCVGATMTLSDGTTGGSWGSTNPAVATVTGSTGIVSGIGVGTTTISYTLGFGCTVNKTVTVDPLPNIITGPSAVCFGQNITLASTTPGGFWSSSAPLTASVSSTGVVAGLAPGTATISYTMGTGCMRTKTITVNPGPALIIGTPAMCVGQSVTLSDIGGGTWSSSTPGVATVGLTSGIVTGVTAGTATISYSLGTGCAAIKTATVYPIPSAIIGDTTVCQGLTKTLSDATLGGTWSVSNPAIATIGLTSGIVTGVSSGTTVISYTSGIGCRVIRPMIVYPISPILGPNVVCPGQSIILSDTTMGGAWFSSNPAVATATTTSMFTGNVTGVATGTATISYRLPTGCFATHAVNVLSVPPVITGPSQVCVGNVILLSDAAAGGTWDSDNPAVAAIGTTGDVTGITAGTAVISYTLGTGCPRTKTITVNPLPGAITGGTNVCVGRTTTLSNPAPGGLWSSSIPGIARVGSTTGIVSGVATGTTIITYRLSTGCLTTTPIAVDPLPSAITGVPNMCVGAMTTLSDATIGGTWVSDMPAIASVNMMTGDVTGWTAGTVLISYVLPTGCFVSQPVTVHALPPAILGSPNVCQGSTITLTNPATGGTWMSSNPGYGTIGTTSGMLTGIAPGTTTIIYTLGTGCATSTNVVIDQLPTPITGPTNICITTSTTLFNGLPGGAWSSSNTNATIDAGTGLVTGVTPGTATITYMMPTGCYVTVPLNISPLPTAISGNPYICLGSSVSFSDGVAGGIWSSTNSSVGPIGSLTGIVYGANVGSTTVQYTLGPGCVASLPVNVVPLPTVFTVTGGGNFCSGGAGVRIGLNGSQVGTNYLLYRGSTPTGTFIGTGLPLDFGLQTVGGSYTVVAISTPSGCSQAMFGGATIGVIPSVIPSVNITVPTTDTVCSGATATFIASPVNGGSSPAYVWSVNGTNVGLGSSYAFIPANGDVVKVTMTSSATCAAPLTAEKLVTMSVLPQGLPTAALVGDPGDMVCKGTQVTVSVLTDYAGVAPTFMWKVNGVTVPGVTGRNLAIEPDNGDVVYCIMTSNYPCRTATTAVSNTMTFVVDTPVTPIVTINAYPGTAIGWGQYDTLVADVTNNTTALTYQWIVNGVPVTGATNSVYISNNFNHPKQDSVTCMVTSGGICPVTTFGWVYINSTNVGVKPVLNGNSDITVVPNPNKGVFVVKGTLATTTDEEVTMEVTNVIGQVVYKDQVTAKQGKLNQQIQLNKNLANGMYILNLHTEAENRVFHIVVEQ